MPKIIIFVQRFSHLSSAWLININYFKTCCSFLNSYRNFFEFWEFDNNLFDKLLITLTNDFRFLFLYFFFSISLERLNEWFSRNDFHQFKWKDRYFVCFNVFFNHPGELNNFVTIFLFLVLNLSGNFEWFMFFTKDKVFYLLQIQLLHVNFFLSCTFWMIVLFALLILAFNASSSSRFFAYKTLMFIPFLLNVLYTFYINCSIFLLEITFRNPYRAHIMNPNIMAYRLILWVTIFVKVIIK